ncbi:MAG: hypothetical protein MJ033_02125 [Victivallaceae bacterium]|nr:hypothetical protein [Victivallaceae bacterium]
MSAYLGLLDEAVNSFDIVRTRSRICNLLAERDGLTGAEISKKISLIADTFSAAGKNLFAEDNGLSLDLSIDEFDKGISRLNVNFSRVKVEQMCRLKDSLHPSGSDKHTQNTLPPQSSCAGCKNKRMPRPALYYTIRGVAIGGVGGIALGIFCHRAVALFFCASVIGGAIGYAFSKINEQ